MKTENQLEQLHYKSNASIDSDPFLTRLNNKIDESDSNRGRNQGLILSSLAIVLMLFMMPIQEDLDDSMEMYGQYLSEYGTDTYEMIALLSENDLTFEQ
ncbi:MAG: hypothetical protein CM1200mP1_02280 [Candidatus Neomarinimicrobiota bacterium]|nr:MAG: hypothetical protein CM1200mP1_02280 [Candidatus Neomarinimicrobiota bacterium]